MNVNSAIIEKSKTFVKEVFDENVSSDFAYHNFEHTMDVYNASVLLATHSKLEKKDVEVLLLSALFHDVGFSIDRFDHEEHSKKIATEFLEKESYDKTKLTSILNCIDATRMGEKPINQLQMLMKDADLSGLSSNKYIEHAEQIRKELNNFGEEKISKGEWRKINYEFIKNHNYYSESAKELFGPLKLENEKSLKNMLDQKKNKKKEVVYTIANSKSAQTQFKTALRNHIDLSAIADNKANIMLSVNALIITVALPILAETVTEIPIFLYPTISLLIVSVTSMIFATLATRPIKMKGNTTINDVKQKKSNLFFFGNFYNMKFNDYELGIKEVVADEHVLDNAITRDLFYLGKALGSKYNNLRWCYNIFMYGIVFTVTLFGVVLLVQNSLP